MRSVSPRPESVDQRSPLTVGSLPQGRGPDGKATHDMFSGGYVLIEVESPNQREQVAVEQRLYVYAGVSDMGCAAV